MVLVRRDAPGPGRTSIATRYFVDTNVWVYAVDRDEPIKRDIARAFIAEHQQHLVLSTQVMVEVVSALTRKLGVSLPSAEALLRELEAFEILPTTADLVIRGTQTAHAHQLSIWDALIVEAAAAGSCDVLVSEDLHDGAVLRGIRLHNPFAAAGPSGSLPRRATQ